MKKILILFIISIFLFAGNIQKYQYQLGVFKNNPYIYKNINKLKNIIIINKKGKYYYVKSKIYNNYKEIIKDKIKYQKVFPDLYLIKPIKKKVNYKLLNKIKNDNNKLNFKSNEDVEYFKKQIVKNKNKYLKILNNKKPFIGLYIIGTAEKNLNSNNFNYDLGLKWDFFKNGYYEAKKKLERKKNESIIQYYQLLLNMKEKTKDEYLYKLNLMENYARLQYYLKLSDIYQKILKKRIKLINYGFDTKLDIEDLKNKINIIKDNIYLYGISKYKSIDLNTFMMLNSLEDLNLKSKKVILNYIYKTDLNILIQNYFAKRSNFYDEWNDNLKFNIYVKHNYYNTSNDNIIGLHFEVPIDNYTDENKELIKLEKKNYLNQKESIKIRLKEKLDSLYNQFYFEKSRIKILRKELKFIQLNNKIEKIKEKHYINNVFKKNPKRLQELFEIKILNIKQQIIEKRFDLFRKLIQIYFLSNRKKIYEILER